MNTTNADSFSGRLGRLPHHVKFQTSLDGREDQSAGRTHRAAFGWRRDPYEDRPEYEKDQRQWRHQHEDRLFGDARQQIEPQKPVRHRDNECDRDADRKHQNHEVGARTYLGSLHREIGDDPRDDGYDEERQPPHLAVGVHQALRLGREARRRVRKQHRDTEYVGRVHRRQHEPGNECAGVHVADRAPELIGHDDEDERRRDDLRKCARRSDHAACEPAVVAVAQHDRQRYQAHGDDRRGHDARRGGKQRANEDHCVSKAAAHGAE